MHQFSVTPIGSFAGGEQGFQIRLEAKYAPALEGLEGFSHLQVLWWFSRADDPGSRATLTEKRPYRTAPPRIGTFATRSPRRPNPIALSCVQILAVDREAGVIHIPYVDAEPGTPILDIKPYTPSLDRVESPGVPDWCAGWPRSLEASASFDWEAVFIE